MWLRAGVFALLFMSSNNLADAAPQSNPKLCSPCRTEQNVRDWLNAQGFSQVVNIIEDSEGVWLADIVLGGKTLRVGIDGKGSVGRINKTIENVKN